MIVDSSPYLRPLARIQDEWESFTLLMISCETYDFSVKSEAHPLFHPQNIERIAVIALPHEKLPQRMVEDEFIRFFKKYLKI